MAGKVRREDLLIVLEDVLVNVLLLPSTSTTVIFIPEGNVTGGTAIINVVGVSSSR